MAETKIETQSISQKERVQFALAVSQFEAWQSEGIAACDIALASFAAGSPLTASWMHTNQVRADASNRSHLGFRGGPIHSQLPHMPVFNIGVDQLPYPSEMMIVVFGDKIQMVYQSLDRCGRVLLRRFSVSSGTLLRFATTSYRRQQQLLAESGPAEDIT